MPRERQQVKKQLGRGMFIGHLGVNEERIKIPSLLLNWTNPSLHVFIYMQQAIPKGENQIQAGINPLESDRHDIIACIARASIGNINRMSAHFIS